jgi:NADP-dependent 3-hydroxy acid dehydrogenase YdfG
MKVIGFDIKIDAIEQLKAQLKTAEIYAKICDITNDEDTINAFNWVKDNFGGVDIL